MDDFKLYSAQDVEDLKQKIAIYKDTLNTLKIGNPVDDYLYMKSELNSLKKKAATEEGVAEKMDEKQSMQVKEYEQQVKKISIQIDSLSQTVEVLSRDLSFIINSFKKKDIHAPTENIDNLDYVLHPITASNENKVINADKETIHLKDQTLITTKNTNPFPSYKQFQRFLNNASDIHEAPVDVPQLESIGIQKEEEDLQPLNRRKFPSMGIDTVQINNSQLRSSQMKPPNSINKVVMKQAYPLKENNITSPPFPQNTPKLVENNVIMESSEIEINEDVLEAPVEKQQEVSKSKETFSFLNFFQKKS